MDEHVFMLRIPYNEVAFPVPLGLDELAATYRRVGVDERKSTVVVPAGRHAALATIPREDHVFTRFIHDDGSELRVHVAGSQFRCFYADSREGQARPFFGSNGSVI